MSFSRSPSGLVAEHIFRKAKIHVYVEGPTDITFYDEILQKYDCRIQAKGGKPECEKLVEKLVEKDLPYVVILDGHYEILENIQSQHNRVVLLHRHSYENYLIEEEPIKQFCRDCARSKDSLAEPLTSTKFRKFLEDTEIKLKDLFILDVAHQRSKTGCKTFFRNPDDFFKTDFQDDEIQKQEKAAAKKIQTQGIDEAKTLIEKSLKDRRCIDLLPGHFAIGIIRCLINDTIGKRVKKEEIRLYLSRVVWRLVKTRDHNSLKRRLRKAVREAEQIRQAISDQPQSNTGS